MQHAASRPYHSWAEPGSASPADALLFCLFLFGIEKGMLNPEAGAFLDVFCGNSERLG
jgi:hypothetical protein